METVDADITREVCGMAPRPGPRLAAALLALLLFSLLPGSSAGQVTPVPRAAHGEEKDYWIPDEALDHLSEERLLSRRPMGSDFMVGVYDPHGYFETEEERGLALLRARLLGLQIIARPQTGAYPSLDVVEYADPTARGVPAEYKSSTRATNPQNAFKHQFRRGLEKWSHSLAKGRHYHRGRLVIDLSRLGPSPADVTRWLRGQFAHYPSGSPGRRALNRMSVIETHLGPDQAGDERRHIHDTRNGTDRVVTDRGNVPPGPPPEAESPFEIREPPPACFVGACHAGRAHATTSPLENAMAQMQAAPGGIDLSSVELSYLSLGSAGDDAEIEYAFQVEGGRAAASLTDGLANARQASDAFFVWLGLRRSTFWVNLKPDEPNRIVDPQLGRTLVGKVMLEADLELKRADARLIRPSTPFGGRVWAATGGCIPSRRLWISPGTARVHEDGDSLYILDTPLQVNVEPWTYRPGPGEPRPPGSDLCRGLSDRAMRRAITTYRGLVEPRLTRTVNRAAQFAALRRVYRSRVAAEWYRDRTEDRDTLFGPIIDSGRVGRWSGTGAWRPRETYRAYLDSWSNGEYRDTFREGSTYWTVTIGGVDFGDVPSRAVDADVFLREHPGLEAAVRQAVTGGPPARSGSQGYVGSTGTVDRAVIEREFPAAPGQTDGPDDGAGAPSAVYGAIALVGGGLLLVGFAVVRRVRHRTPKGAT